MRTRVGVALVTVCLGLAGCSLFGKKQTAHNTNPKPFLGSEKSAPREAPVVSETGGPLPGANGLLAGRVVDTSSDKLVKARIEIKDLDDDSSKAAPVDKETTDDGFFTILGLIPGHHYQLIARAKEGNELASGQVIVIPPKSTLYIRINKRFTTPNTPPVPDPPAVPGKKTIPSTESGQERTPAANLDPPVKIPPSRNLSPSRESEASPTSGNGFGGSPDPTHIAEGFQRAPKIPTVEIQGPGQQYRTAPAWSVPPPPPTWESMPDERQPQAAPTPPVTPSQPPLSIHTPTQRVPFCVLIGNKLDNFGLNDVDGQRWEYRHDQRGRLVLLDFWYSTCGPCLQAIPYLVELQRAYGPYGLKVVGIACETGPVEEQRRRVLSVRGRYHINYTTLLSGGGPGHCPVMEQFQADYFPMLVLLDESGRIVWRSRREGMDDYAHETLRRLIEQRLFTNPPR